MWTKQSSTEQNRLNEEQNAKQVYAVNMGEGWTIIEIRSLMHSLIDPWCCTICAIYFQFGSIRNRCSATWCNAIRCDVTWWVTMGELLSKKEPLKISNSWIKLVWKFVFFVLCANELTTACTLQLAVYKREGAYRKRLRWKWLQFYVCACMSHLITQQHHTPEHISIGFIQWTTVW